MTELMDVALAHYVQEHCTPPDDLLRELTAETAERFPDAAGMQVSADEGRLLTLLVQLTGVRRAVEIGVFTGYSALCIARGLADGGRLLACDVSQEWTAVARRYWQRAGVDERIELRLGPALSTLQGLDDEPIDFAFIDADKVGYPDYYQALVPRLRPGGLIVLDNVLFSGQVLDPAPDRPAARAIQSLNDTILQDDRVDSVMLPVRDGVTLVRKR